MAQTILSNSVGKITHDELRVKTAKGGFVTVKLEDILAIKFKLKRKYLYAALCFSFGLAALFVIINQNVNPPEGGRRVTGGFIVVIVLIVAGLANLLGYYVIEIQTKKRVIKLEDVEFNKLKDGRKFIETLQKLIKEKTPDNPS